MSSGHCLSQTSSKKQHISFNTASNNGSCKTLYNPTESTETTSTFEPTHFVDLSEMNVKDIIGSWPCKHLDQKFTVEGTGSSCSSMISSASTVASSILSIEISSSSSICESHQLLSGDDSRPWQGVDAKQPVQSKSAPATMISFPFPVRPLPQSFADVAAAEGRDFLRIFESASASTQMYGGICARPSRRRRTTPPFRAQVLDNEDVTVAEAAAAFVAVAAAERAAAERPGHKRVLESETEVEEFSLGGGTPFSRLSPAAAAAAAAASAVAYSKQAKQRR